MNPEKLGIQTGIIFISIMFVLGVITFFLPIHGGSDWEKYTKLEDVDSLKVQIISSRIEHGILMFNGKYVTDDGTMSFHKLNGRRFEWENFYTPFFLEKKLNNDTITITKNKIQYKFLIDR